MATRKSPEQRRKSEKKSGWPRGRVQSKGGKVRKSLVGHGEESRAKEKKREKVWLAMGKSPEQKRKSEKKFGWPRGSVQSKRGKVGKSLVGHE